ncbi:MAG TPA: topoisomerase DNA-binding C4 zinc finger domain-containing protein [bacterium]|nr:topoisomerase DNA-binding C4 zinc finger domain-containing protein [bacterium]HPY15126.1 topoisomerase DNA-binding C4 zinc finger domain-containing protein [bacterium]HQB10498.1 topoisomerase DNA-binding C4 zinc finger domain-containing protein [bacterium]HQM86144.1 topoisomerase DNA-binding C4 zinc finger domain-containing protein [bacterium]HRQ70812.1 topoisomerase DNA-binding C4 zinc finger domain-containing protein [bacterium]
MNTGWVICKGCGAEYFIEHKKYPVKDEGDSLSCEKCGELLHKWGKGTDDYILFTKEQMQKIEKEKALIPRCDCGAKMLKRKGKWGYFWGCSKFPNCQKTKKI